MYTANDDYLSCDTFVTESYSIILANANTIIDKRTDAVVASLALLLAAQVQSNSSDTVRSHCPEAQLSDFPHGQPSSTFPSEGAHAPQTQDPEAQSTSFSQLPLMHSPSLLAVQTKLRHERDAQMSE